MKSLTLLIKPAAGLCNMNCGYCFYRAASETRENRVMTEDTADMLIQRIKEYRPSALSVMFQGGEPTLAGRGFFRSFTEKLERSVPVPVSYALQTNGLLIDDGFARFFGEHGFLIGISLDGDEKTNGRFRLDRNGAGVFTRVLNAAATLEKHNVEYNILSVIDDENAKDTERTYAFFKKHGFRFLQFIPCIDEGGGVSLSEDGYAYFLKRSFDLWYDDFIRGEYISIRHIDNYVGVLMGNPPENCAMCGVCGSYYVVEADGSLYPCDFYCRDEYRLGSVFDDAPFAPNGKQKDFIRQSHMIHGLCRDCEYYVLCRGGCRRDRTDGFTKNRYCRAYREFFDHAADRMAQIARGLMA